MEVTETKKKLKRSLLLLRIWFWAAVRSPYFHYCQLYFDHPPIQVDVCWSKHNYEFLRIQIVFNRPKLNLSIPWTICLDFIKARKESGEIIQEETIIDIPF